MRLRKRAGPWPRTFAAFGVGIRVVVDNPGLWPAIEEILPPGNVPCGTSEVTETFALRTSGADNYTMVAGETSWVEHAELDVAVNALDQQLRIHIAAHAPGLIFVHAGVVAIGGRALMIPGQSFTGKTTLVQALVRSGATYYSDEYAVLDADGRVHPYPRRLSVRTERGEPSHEQDVGELGGVPAQGSAEVAIIAITQYRAHAEWRPEQVSTGDGVVGLMANAVPAQQRPRESLHVLGRAARGARILRSDRGEAGTTAPELIRVLSGETQRSGV